MTITIVGAGIIGCALAHELASRGARVRVVDARGPGQGATRASAGMLAPYIEGHIGHLYTLGVRSLALYDRFVARVGEDAGEPVEYERAGTLQVAVGATEAADLCAAARLLAAAGVGHTLLDAAETMALEPHLRQGVACGLLIGAHGYVAATALTRALATAAQKHGAEFASEPVLAIEAGAAPRVITRTQTVESDAVVIAAGSWSSALVDQPALSPALKPIRGQLVQMKVALRPAARIVWGSSCYLVPWRDGTVLAGATVEDVGFDEAATVAGVQQLLAASAALMPSLRDAAFQEVRTGLRPLTQDELPAIGPSSTMRQVFYATGHYRNGVLLAPLTASLLADLLLDGREGAELALVRPARLGL